MPVPSVNNTEISANYWYFPSKSASVDTPNNAAIWANNTSQHRWRFVHVLSNQAVSLKASNKGANQRAHLAGVHLSRSQVGCQPSNTPGGRN